jgi:hypothetical protein
MSEYKKKPPIGLGAAFKLGNKTIRVGWPARPGWRLPHRMWPSLVSTPLLPPLAHAQAEADGQRVPLQSRLMKGFSMAFRTTCPKWCSRRR